MRTTKNEDRYKHLENSLNIVKALEEKVAKFDYEFQKKCVEEKKRLISQYPQDQILLAYFSNWKDQACVEVWTEMLKKAHKEEEKDTKKFFTLIAKNYKLWWD